MTKQSPQHPTSHLDVRAFARTGGSLGGSVPLSAFARVAQDCADGGADATVVWSAYGQSRGADGAAVEPWLHLQVRTELPLVCQRCLEPMRAQAEVDQWYRFVSDEATAELQDDDATEDLLVESADFDLRELVEDELVLAMPLIPSHDTCPSTPVMSAKDASFDAPVNDKPHPFAALAQLRQGKGGKGV
jgi:uncharacterized protein